MRIVNWNIEQQGPATLQAKSLLAEIAESGPDVLCLTEAWEGSAEALGGHAISAAGAARNTKHNRVWEFFGAQQRFTYSLIAQSALKREATEFSKGDGVRKPSCRGDHHEN